jgi:hypothetical protein
MENTYALEAVGLDRVKIGRTRNVVARALELQVGCPAPLRLIGFSPNDIERSLHARLRSYRIQGEWFALNDDSRAVITHHMRTRHIVQEIEMPKAPASLSSRDPSTRSIAVRLPSDLSAAIDAYCAEHNTTASELLRGLVSAWVYGESALSGPDAGYTQAKSMASQIAHAALRDALASVPDTHEGAQAMLKGYYESQADRRRG